MTAVHSVFVAKPAATDEIVEEIRWLPGEPSAWTYDTSYYYQSVLSTGQDAAISARFLEDPPAVPSSIIADAPFPARTSWEYVHLAHEQGGGWIASPTNTPFAKYGFGVWLKSDGEHANTEGNLAEFPSDIGPAHYIALISWETRWDTGRTYEDPEYPGELFPVYQRPAYYIVLREGALTLLIHIYERDTLPVHNWEETVLLSGAAAMLAAGWCYLTASFVPATSSLALRFYEADGTPHILTASLPEIPFGTPQTLIEIGFANWSFIAIQPNIADKPQRFADLHWTSGAAYPTARPTSALSP